MVSSYVYRLKGNKHDIPPTHSTVIMKNMKTIFRFTFERQRMIFNTKKSNLIFLRLTCRLQGGGGTAMSDRAYTAIHKSSINMTSARCCISLNDDIDTYRGVMSCGHAVDPEGLLAFGDHEILKRRESRLTCPAIVDERNTRTCNKEWPYSEFRK